jgi:hypothetical protein
VFQSTKLNFEFARKFDKLSTSLLEYKMSSGKFILPEQNKNITFRDFRQIFLGGLCGYKRDFIEILNMSS